MTEFNSRKVMVDFIGIIQTHMIANTEFNIPLKPNKGARE